MTASVRTIVIGTSAAFVLGILAAGPTAEGGASFQGLGDLPDGKFYSEAAGVSADGLVVVGFGNSASGPEAFRWTQATGMVGLGDLLGGQFRSGVTMPTRVSADGSVVVGYSDSALGGEGFRWTQATGMVGLGYISPSFFSADGSVVVG